MDKRQELLEKLDILVQEIEKAKKIVDDEKKQYLNNYENRIEVIIKELYDAASDVDLFYIKECQKW